MQEELHRTEDLNPSVAADIAESATATSEVPLGGTEDMIEFSTLIAQCQQELAEAKNANLRAHADFDNYRKRMRAERDQEYIRGRDRVIMELLPIIDDFERALSAAPEEKTANSLRKGVELIHRQMLNMLGRYGITAMHVDSQRFDPLNQTSQSRNKLNVLRIISC